jgi:hypothetical protein
MTQFMPDPVWPTIVELAIERWGAPNETLSKRDGSEVRFGTNGSKSVKPAQNIWRDHEVGEGGGYIDMYHAVRGELPPRSRKANGEANGHAAPAKPRPRRPAEAAFVRRRAMRVVRRLGRRRTI